jgi:hypothetical protein
MVKPPEGPRLNIDWKAVIQAATRKGWKRTFRDAGRHFISLGVQDLFCRLKNLSGGKLFEEGRKR